MRLTLCQAALPCFKKITAAASVCQVGPCRDSQSRARGLDDDRALRGQPVVRRHDDLPPGIRRSRRRSDSSSTAARACRGAGARFPNPRPYGRCARSVRRRLGCFPQVSGATRRYVLGSFEEPKHSADHHCFATASDGFRDDVIGATNRDLPPQKRMAAGPHVPVPNSEICRTSARQRRQNTLSKKPRICHSASVARM